MYFPKLNVFVFIIAMVFFLEQNLYWGWNVMPTSERELITDGFNMILLAMAWMVPATNVTGIGLHRDS